MARNSSVAKLSASTLVAASHKDLGRPATTGEPDDANPAEEYEDEDNGEDDDGAPTFGSDIFRVPLSELLEDDLDATKFEAGGAARGGGVYDNDEDSDLPSLSECLDFFIMCFSAASHPPPTSLQL
ncbi:hypothetical protein PybrP1_001876 [[Pythium] brassicae (nom. inval.)]|nr:hypothetical protein PybrP1_001876 [[Pythium] brassicae (nom. inval.)]